MLVQKHTWPCWLKLWYITSTYQEHLLSGVLKRKRLRLVSKAIFYFNKVFSCKILTCIRREAVVRYVRTSSLASRFTTVSLDQYNDLITRYNILSCLHSTILGILPYWCIGSRSVEFQDIDLVSDQSIFTVSVHLYLNVG